jgi:probable HAF family extracellular repeat protein
MKNKIGKFSVLVVLGILLASGIALQPASAQVTVTTTDLGTLGGRHSAASDINDLGQVVGQADDPDHNAFPFLWTEADGMTNLGALGVSWGAATSVNELGTVVGDAIWPSGSRHAFRWTAAEGMVDLGTLPPVVGCPSPEPPWSAATAINDLGQIVGVSTNCQGVLHAVLWDSDTIIDLGTLGGDIASVLENPYIRSAPEDINELGQVVGWSWTADGERYPFLITPQDSDGDGTPDKWAERDEREVREGLPMVTNLLMTNLGTLGGTTGNVANAINNLGQIVGVSTILGPQGDSLISRAFFWEDGVMMDIFAPDSESVSLALDINDLEQVVGQTDIWSTTGSRAFLWTPTDGATDIGSVGGANCYSESRANAINNINQAVGSYCIGDNLYHAVLYSIEEPPQTVEERLDALREKIKNQIASGAIGKGQGNSLLKKIDAAKKKFTQVTGNTQPEEQSVKTTINILKATINQIDAYEKAGIISETDADELVTDFNQLIADIGG